MNGEIIFSLQNELLQPRFFQYENIPDTKAIGSLLKQENRNKI